MTTPTVPRTGSPRIGLDLADPLMDFHTEWEGGVLKFMAGRLGDRIEHDDWPTRARADTTRFRREVARSITRLERQAAPAVERMVADAYTRGRGQAHTGEARSLAARTVAKLRDMWRALTGATERQWHLAVTAGATAPPDRRRQAVQHILDQLASRGFVVFRDASGRQVSARAWTEQTVRTAAGHAAIGGYLDRLQAAGLDLVRVRATPTSCPICIPWVGKVLSITGDTPGYRTIKDARDAGLWHPNCQHPIDVWDPAHPHAPRPVKPRPGGYDAAQRQREIARHVQAWQRRETVALDDTARARARRKIRQWRAALRTLRDRLGGR